MRPPGRSAPSAGRPLRLQPWPIRPAARPPLRPPAPRAAAVRPARRTDSPRRAAASLSLSR
eukprot:5651505-Lingulodinium_polyedra.AAC.1